MMATLDLVHPLFGVDNLPYGVFSTPTTGNRVGVRLGDSVIDLVVALGDPTFASNLNPFLAQGPSRWREVRGRIVDLIVAGIVPDGAVHRLVDVWLHLPFDVADYVDFYASEHHAANLGRLFRPDSEPLLPNWKHLPVGYHGRAGTIVVSGTAVRRPEGQRKRAEQPAPDFGPSRRLDIEAEVGFVVGVGSEAGRRIAVDEFVDHVFGAVLVNDWSARDIQAWEYVPLGPFLGKSFVTSISAWVTPLEALQAARIPLPAQHPPPLPYLSGTEPWGLDVDLEVRWNGQLVLTPPYAGMYWSPAQMLAHTTVNGATARTGDLFASGTVSGGRRDQCGSLIELTSGGAEPVQLDGERRTFLEDGDEVVITATAPSPAGRLGLGEVRGRIVPATVA